MSFHRRLLLERAHHHCQCSCPSGVWIGTCRVLRMSQHKSPSSLFHFLHPVLCPLHSPYGTCDSSQDANQNKKQFRSKYAISIWLLNFEPTVCHLIDFDWSLKSFSHCVQFVASVVETPSLARIFAHYAANVSVCSENPISARPAHIVTTLVHQPIA